MKCMTIIVGIIMLLGNSAVFACTIADPQKVEIGANRGIEGLCSNNDEEISCEYVTGEGVRCDGPEGSFSGQDLSTVIFSACGCSYESLPERQIENNLQKNK